MDRIESPASPLDDWNNARALTQTDRVIVVGRMRRLAPLLGYRRPELQANGNRRPAEKANHA